MGEAAHAKTLRESARLAEQANLDSLWVQDHIAIPPGETEGSGGRYLDPLSLLSWLAAATERIHLGTGVLILPYRRALPTAKAVATIQELSNERLELGIGVGWMKAEFAAVGVDMRRRARITDETLEFFNAAFDAPDDETVSQGQPFVFRPNPRKPRILVGGGAPHALDRAARLGDGWLPMTSDPEALADPVAELRSRFSDAGRGEPDVVVLGALGHDSEAEDFDRLARLEALGVTDFIQGARYVDLDGFRRSLDPMIERRDGYREAAGR
jgi:probable F420-dependent oxidoreductase